jgi:integrase/recombinase XerD
MTLPTTDDDDVHRLATMWLAEQADSTRDEYERDLHQFLDWLDVDFRSVTLEELQAYRDHLMQQYARSTCKRKVSSLKSLFSFGARVGLFDHNPAEPLSAPRPTSDRADRILSVEQVQDILDAPTTDRGRAIVHFLYGSGARVSEATALRWDDVTPRPDQDGGQVTLRGKSDATRNVLMGGSAWHALQTLPHREGPVFRSKHGGPLDRSRIFRIVKRIATRADVEVDGDKSKVSPHWLRHAHASHALRGGASLELVRDTLGHASVQTTDTYLHARPQDSSNNYLPNQ